MGVFTKLKDVLFDIEEENEIPVITKEEKITDDSPIKEVKMPKEETFDDFEPLNEEIEEKPIPKKEFNFPLDDFEDEIPSRSLRSNNNLFDEDFTKKADLNVRNEKPVKKYDDYEYDYSRINLKDIKKEETKNFKPSPVISPVYGILDQNYTKDDVIVKNDGSKRKENTTPNLDEVRKRAYGKKKEEIKESKEDIEPLKTLDDILGSDDTEEIPMIKQEVEPILDENSRVGVYDDELPDEPYADEIKEKQENNNDLETDLFNLIDSMYEEKNESEE